MLVTIGVGTRSAAPLRRPSLDIFGGEGWKVHSADCSGEVENAMSMSSSTMSISLLELPTSDTVESGELSSCRLAESGSGNGRSLTDVELVE